MMRKILALLFSLCACAAQAQTIIGTLPFTLQNGTIADANQVMADFNTIIAAVNANAANAGANSNITALNGLTTPLVYTSGGTSNYIGGTSSGSANAQVVASPIPSGFNLIAGKSITFIAGFTNSGPTTLNVAATGAVNVFRPGASGPLALGGGEITVGNVITATYDGTEYQLVGSSPQALTQPCTVIDWAGASAPSGYLLLNGQTVSRTTFAALFGCISAQGVAATTSNGSASVVVGNANLYQIGWSVGGNNVTCNSTITAIPDGTHITISNTAGASGATTLTIGPYGQGDCSATFAVGDFRGRAAMMRDTSTLVLSSATCSNPSTIGQNCGNQTQNLNLAQTPTGINSPVTVQSSSNQFALFGSSSQTTCNASGGGSCGTGVAGLTNGTFVTSTGTATSNNTSGSAHPILPPVALVDKYIKF